jgi:hypothetical protein
MLLEDLLDELLLLDLLEEELLELEDDLELLLPSASQVTSA